MSFVLQPLKKKEIEKIFDKKAVEVVNYFLKMNSFSHPEGKVGQKRLKFQVTKENMEQWIVQALDAEPLGAGSYPVDIKTKDFLADIKSMSVRLDKDGNIKNAESGETSLAQKFSAEKNLDKLFQTSKFNQIKNLWVKILSSKYKQVVEDQKIDLIYYIFLMRVENKYYLFMTKVDYKKITEEFLKVNNSRSTKSSVFVKNMIDDKFGNVKIYKAKKRMELRLLPKYFIDNNYYIDFIPLEYPDDVDLRKTKIKEHIKNKINKFFSVMF
ncbi:MAG: hypothetical protein OIF36_03820 [Alphaproteobacteria bacterium]|nr:hypothetical protein [Alphaproteobacteria bacterium]